MKKFLLTVAMHITGLYLALWVIPATLITWHNEQLTQLLTILMKRIREFEKQS
ncbi:hypothetical protein PM116P4_00036 [Parabacteroides phage PM116P4]|nr:hypothetical protein PM116P4_00036 [Parabacteroides phage PM116P4]WAX17529.1 hypothetical protein PM116P5_00013 [Parabacteroides phage PM116P5]